MKTEARGAGRDALLVAILCWTALVMGVQFFLPLVRSLTQGDVYPWGLEGGFRGHGLHGDFWVLVVGLSVASLVLYLGWRGAPRLFCLVLLAIHVPTTAFVIRAALADPASFRFEGATIGVELSLAVVGPLLFGVFTVAAIVWVVRDLRTQPSRPLAPWIWTRSTRVRLLLVAAGFIVETALFRSGGLTSIQNVIGVAIVGWQWVVLNHVLARMPFAMPTAHPVSATMGTPEAGA